MNSPLVTVGMPVLNNAATIRRALRSIQLQSVTKWEMILIDDGSVDGTLTVSSDLLADSRIRVRCDGHHLGIAARLNETLNLARGRYYARMDGDDVSYPERLERQLGFMQAHSEVDLVGTPMLVIDSHGEPLGERRGPTSHDLICRHPALGFRMFHPTFFGRTEWFQQHPYRRGNEPAEDRELLLRTHRESRFANLDLILLGYNGGRIRLARSLRGRWNWVKMVHDSSEFRTGTTLVAAAAQLSLAAWDAAAIGVGPQKQLLRQRQRPTSPLEITRWEQVLRSVSADAGETHAP